MSGQGNVTQHACPPTRICHDPRCLRLYLRLLRSEFAFDGVAMTDAFSMAGVREGTTLGDIAVEALAAGEDMLIIDNPSEVEPAVQAIIQAVNARRLDRDRLAQAAGRVRRLAMSVAPVECGS